MIIHWNHSPTPLPSWKDVQLSNCHYCKKKKKHTFENQPCHPFGSHVDHYSNHLSGSIAFLWLFLLQQDQQLPDGMDWAAWWHARAVCDHSEDPRNWLHWDKKMHFIWLLMYLAREFKLRTIFLSLPRKMGSPFFEVMQATRRSSGLHEWQR